MAAQMLSSPINISAGLSHRRKLTDQALVTVVTPTQMLTKLIK